MLINPCFSPFSESWRWCTALHEPQDGGQRSGHRGHWAHHHDQLFTWAHHHDQLFTLTGGGSRAHSGAGHKYRTHHLFFFFPHFSACLHPFFHVEILLLKGLGHEIEFEYVAKNEKFQVSDHFCQNIWILSHDEVSLKGDKSEGRHTARVGAFPSPHPTQATDLFLQPISVRKCVMTPSFLLHFSACLNPVFFTWRFRLNGLGYEIELEYEKKCKVLETRYK